VSDEAVSHAIFIASKEENDIHGAADGGDFQHDAAAAKRGIGALPAIDDKIDRLLIDGEDGALKPLDAGR